MTSSHLLVHPRKASVLFVRSCINFDWKAPRHDEHRARRLVDVETSATEQNELRHDDPPIKTEANYVPQLEDEERRIEIEAYKRSHWLHYPPPWYDEPWARQLRGVETSVPEQKKSVHNDPQTKAEANYVPRLREESRRIKTEAESSFLDQTYRYDAATARDKALQPYRFSEAWAGSALRGGEPMLDPGCCQRSEASCTSTEVNSSEVESLDGYDTATIHNEELQSSRFSEYLDESVSGERELMLNQELPVSQPYIKKDRPARQSARLST
ncbi:hypothetical protein N7470_002619 [Penicillium chermesinum]|nr:hypothetical protein N7470_002619 [Penicillium chermesinum]